MCPYQVGALHHTHEYNITQTCVKMPCTYVPMYVCTYLRTQSNTCTYTHMHMYTHVDTQTHKNTYIHAQTHAHMQGHTHPCMHACTHARTHTHLSLLYICKYVYIHTQ